MYNDDFCPIVIAKGRIKSGCRNEEHKYFFDAGFNEMIQRIKPKKILFQCNKKYKENYKDERIIFVDSFWDNKRKQLKNK